MKICYLPADMDGPGFYRCLSPGRQLNDHGHEVFMPEREEKAFDTEWPLLDREGHQIEDRTYTEKRYRTLFKTSFDLPQSADLYVFQQWKERVVSEEGIPKLRAFGMATSMDVDDDYLNIAGYNPAFVGTHPYKRMDGTILNRDARRAIQKNAKRTSLHGMTARMNAGIGTKPKAPPNSQNRLHMLESMKQVDLVTVSTPHLANIYEGHHKNISVIRNYVDWDLFSTVKPQYEVKRERLRIGYLANFRYHRGDLAVLGQSVRRFLLAHPEVDFVASHEMVHVMLGVPVDQRITVGEYEFFDHETGLFQVGERTACIDIGLVPLAMNDLNEGKSHLKGMEYNAAGIPCIASPTESYRYWVEGGYNGWLAESESQWRECMEELVNDPSLREGMGMRGRFKARQHSIQENWRAWDDAYASIVGGEEHKVARRSIAMGAVQKTSELGPFLELVKEKRPKIVVEIGTARGGTLWAMAQVCPDGTHFVSIDIPAGSAMDRRIDGTDLYTGRDRERIKSFIKDTQSLSLIDMNSQSQAARVALMHALKGSKIDLLFIDGDHTYEGVKADFENYRNLVAPDGAIAFHDITHHQDKRVQVERFWGQVKTRYKSREFIGPETWGFNPWGGIGVLELG